MAKTLEKAQKLLKAAISNQLLQTSPWIKKQPTLAKIATNIINCTNESLKPKRKFKRLELIKK